MYIYKYMPVRCADSCERTFYRKASVFDQNGGQSSKVFRFLVWQEMVLFTWLEYSIHRFIIRKREYWCSESSRKQHFSVQNSKKLILFSLDQLKVFFRYVIQVVDKKLLWPNSGGDFLGHMIGYNKVYGPPKKEHM